MVFNLLIGGETNAAAAILAVLRGGRRNRRAATLLGQSDRTLALIGGERVTHKQTNENYDTRD